ncbi:hypothetical protein ACQPZQ_16255 [Pseudonocardia sp. CA-142604]|uniref:hypothetical protein n=1 Tax=Pseudonocardia sp. CA-142604 TaxID=3240024 RepID=UPI003D918557
MTGPRRARGGGPDVGSVSSVRPQAVLGPATATVLVLVLTVRHGVACGSRVRALCEDLGNLLGFVDDGTPKGLTAAAAALIGGHDPEFEGGTFAVARKYVHDPTAWNGLLRRSAATCGPMYRSVR